jgi:deoxyxylulose-5-phosphate synthase
VREAYFNCTDGSERFTAAELPASYGVYWNFTSGGVGSLLMAVKEKHTLNVNIKTFEYEDAFITHGATHLVEEQLGITVEQLAEVISKEFY